MKKADAAEFVITPKLARQVWARSRRDIARDPSDEVDHPTSSFEVNVLSLIVF